MLQLLTSNETVYQVIKMAQMIFVPLFGLMTLIGIFIFTASFKNPMKRRTAFLFTVISPLSFILFLHGPVFLRKYLKEVPQKAIETDSLDILMNWISINGSTVYHIFEVGFEQILNIVFVIGIGILIGRGRNPGRSRLGYGVILGIPLLWMLIAVGPDIYRILVS